MHRQCKWHGNTMFILTRLYLGWESSTSTICSLQSENSLVMQGQKLWWLSQELLQRAQSVKCVVEECTTGRSTPQKACVRSSWKDCLKGVLPMDGGTQPGCYVKIRGTPLSKLNNFMTAFTMTIWKQYFFIPPAPKYYISSFNFLTCSIVAVMYN